MIIKSNQDVLRVLSQVVRTEIEDSFPEWWLEESSEIEWVKVNDIFVGQIHSDEDPSFIAEYYATIKEFNHRLFFLPSDIRGITRYDSNAPNEMTLLFENELCLNHMSDESLLNLFNEGGYLGPVRFLY